MRRHLIPLTLALLVSSACQGGSPDPNALSAEEASSGWKLLFDGETTAGWRNYGAEGIRDGWQAVDGALARVGPAGDIITVDKYEHFELELEWKIAPGGNSGIFFSVVEGADDIWHSGPEIQICDDAALGEDVSRLSRAGACYALYPPSEDVTRPAGEWNQMRILIDRGNVEQWLNGVLVCKYTVWSQDWNERVSASKFSAYSTFAASRVGYIGLQDHGDEVAFRNIKIREINHGPMR